MAAAGLYGPGRATKGVETLVPPPDVAAAAASRSRPAPGVWVVENTGTDSSDPDGVIPASDNPVPVVERGTLNRGVIAQMRWGWANSMLPRRRLVDPTSD